MTTGTTERRIYFYRIDCGADDGHPRPFDPRPVLAEVRKAPDPRMYDGSNPDRVGWVDSLGAFPTMRLANVRRTSLPEVEEKCQLSPLPLTTRQGLAETVHAVFFPNNVVGIDFNFYGPRPSALGRYLSNKSPSCPPLAFDRLLRNDAAERLQKFDYLSLVRLKTRASYASDIARVSQKVGRMLNAASEIGNAAEVEIMIRSEARSRTPLQGLTSEVRRILGLQDIRENVAKFEVKGLDSETKRTDALDLLSDALVHKAEMVTIDSRSRAVTRESAYRAIKSAYDMLERQIQEAASVF